MNGTTVCTGLTSYEDTYTASILAPERTPSHQLENILEHADNSISLIASNPNKQGWILAYDEGGYEGNAFLDGSVIEWAGIRFISPKTVLLSGVNTVFHLAAIPSGLESVENPVEPIDNVTLTCIANTTDTITAYRWYKNSKLVEHAINFHKLSK